PAIEDIEAVAETNEEYYIAGPFKVKSGTAPESEYKISLLDQNGEEISRDAYSILIEGEKVFKDKNINKILNKEYYIYLPKTNKDITKISLKLSYSSYESEASLWENKTVKEEGVEVYQPVVLITREETPHIQNKDVEI